MRIIKAIKQEKYNEAERYLPVGKDIYENLKDDTYCITLYCELEEEEDTQYPLEDLLDKYYVHCTDFMEEKQIDGKAIYQIEIEGSLLEKEENLKNIQSVAELIGKRVGFFDGEKSQ